jgi:hypothetical protein
MKRFATYPEGTVHAPHARHSEAVYHGTGDLLFGAEWGASVSKRD